MTQIRKKFVLFDKDVNKLFWQSRSEICMSGFDKVNQSSVSIPLRFATFHPAAVSKPGGLHLSSCQPPSWFDNPHTRKCETNLRDLGWGLRRELNNFDKAGHPLQSPFPPALHPHQKKKKGRRRRRERKKLYLLIWRGAVYDYTRANRFQNSAWCATVNVDNLNCSTFTEE